MGNPWGSLAGYCGGAVSRKPAALYAKLILNTISQVRELFSSLSFLYWIGGDSVSCALYEETFLTPGKGQP